MEWPTHNQDDNFRTPGTVYPWSTIDLENWRTDFFKQSQALYMSPSPDPPTIASSSTATSYTHTLQLPSSPESLGTAPSPGLIYSDPSNIKESIKGNDSETFSPRRNGAAISSAASRELEYSSPWADLAASPRQKSTAIQPDGPSNPCLAKSKNPRCSPLTSSKNKK